jgi:ABC-2 type transport system ATP-binding protein
MNYAIETKDLTKKFGSLVAVNNVNLKIKEGEIFGFLGPNGAGKTTTISILTTLLKPTSGTALIGGFDLQKEGAKVRSIIGVVPQTFSLFPELTPIENLAYIGRLYSMGEKAIKERSEYLLKLMTLWEFKDKVAGEFSGGMKQRLSIAASIMPSPKILFMDEPTTGLDPQSRIAIRDLTRELNKAGITIVYTTHDMEEADKLCDRITIMDHGKVVADGTSYELKHMIANGHTLEIELESPSKQIIAELKSLAGVTSVHGDGNLLYVKVKDREGAFFMLNQFFQKNGQKVLELRFKEHSLEDVFVHLTKKDLRE